MAGGGIPLGEWSGSDATNALRESIERFNNRTARQTSWLLGLTWVIAALTLVMAIGVAVQIQLARSAPAERAWVLWQEHRTVGTSWQERTWLFEQAYRTPEECGTRRGMAEAIARNDNETKAAGRVRDDGSRRFYQCIPDTLDPRGPKGK